MLTSPAVELTIVMGNTPLDPLGERRRRFTSAFARFMAFPFWSCSVRLNVSVLFAIEYGVLKLLLLSSPMDVCQQEGENRINLLAMEDRRKLILPLAFGTL